MKTTEIEQHEVVQTLKDLIAINSVNPQFDPASKGEEDVAKYIEDRMRAAELDVSRYPVFPGRDNIVAKFKSGVANAPVLLFEAHMDTVGFGSMPDPLVPIIKDGLMYGRGACDTKATIAGMIYAMEQAAKQPHSLACDLVFCAAVDEEHAYKGLLQFLSLGMKIDGAVVGEPTEMNIVTAHKGCLRFSITTHGKAAHSSVPHEGNSAIKQMGVIFDYIHGVIEPELAKRKHPLCGSPSIVVGTIKGGTQVNVVPEACTIEVDRRMIPGEDAEEVLLQFIQRLEAYVQDKNVQFSIVPLLFDWALNTERDECIVRTAQQVARNLNLDDEVYGVSYGSDASKLQRDGIPSIVFGPGSIDQAHSNAEFVPMMEVIEAADFYWHLAKGFGR